MANGEMPGWYRAKVIEYYVDGSCTVLYGDSIKSTVTEVVRLSEVEWVPCYHRSPSFMPISSLRWRKGLFYVDSK